MKEKMTFEDVFSTADSCSDHRLPLKEQDIEGVKTIIAMGNCNCKPWNEFDETCNSYCDTESFAIGLLRDGRYAFVFESSDTSGHGCQCSGSCEIFDTLENAMMLGLDDSQRRATFKTLGVVIR